MNKKYKEYKVANIDETEAKRLAREVISAITKVLEDAFIKDGKIYHSVECHTSHSWNDDEFVKYVTNFDKSIIELYRKLRK